MGTLIVMKLSSFEDITVHTKAHSKWDHSAHTRQEANLATSANSVLDVRDDESLHTLGSADPGI